MQTINIGLLGLGTVGSGVVQLLQKQALKIEATTNVRFNLKRVAVAHLNKRREATLPSSTKLTDQISEVVNDPEIQIVIETMGTIEPAKKAITQAINNHKSVITANKDLLALEGQHLANIASENKVDFFYEASVAGGIPILRILSNSLVSDDINCVVGIINGTSNYILSCMANSNISYQSALQAAKEKGYAESNPTNDIKGIDSANKLSILSQFAFGQEINPNDFDNTGIDVLTPNQFKSAESFGYTIKLLAIALKKDESLYYFVGPALIASDHQLAHINGVQNAVLVNSEALGSSLYTGAGAGAKPTANSILSDLIATTKDILNKNCGTAFANYSKKLNTERLNSLEQKYLVTGLPLNTKNIDISFIKKAVINGSTCIVTNPISKHNLIKKLGEMYNTVNILPIYDSFKI
ncbi:homoserine dehydrogenase [Limosilactobacillus reuteri]|uniref:homoserine dehydrogenase n=1 Tax=Limosilactobacillus reuteri TaxID=1598 RepID=UPI00204F3214|nr:homoserine dehydrogenase [Limosilactobacillus reuteri]UNL37095.1 homoserine dehydrogenase [Limosilactobacillus reuteri]